MRKKSKNGCNNETKDVNLRFLKNKDLLLSQKIRTEGLVAQLDRAAAF